MKHYNGHNSIRIKGKSVLVICGETKTRNSVLFNIGRGKLYFAETASSLKDGIAKIKNVRFDAAIIDSALLKNKGKVNTLFLRTMNLLMPVIVLAGTEKTDIENRIRGENIFYYMLKPVNREELDEVLKDAFRKI
jgi:DNA-binding NtrC family response regulator